MREIIQISLLTLWISNISAWPSINQNGRRVDLEQKCVQYLIDSNVHAGNLVIIVPNPKKSDDSFIRHTMAHTNVVVVLPSHRPFGEKPIHRYPKNNDISNGFQHKFGIVGFYIIETSLFMMDHVIEFISQTGGYNSRANFILIITDGIAETPSSRRRTAKANASSSSSPPRPSPAEQQQQPTLMFREGETKYRINDDNGTSNGTERHIFLQQTFHRLWRYYIFNAIVMVCDDDDDNDSDAAADSRLCSVYTWFPFDKGSQCGNNTGNVIRIDECVSMFGGDCLHVRYAANHHLRSGHFSIRTENDSQTPRVDDGIHRSKISLTDKSTFNNSETMPSTNEEKSFQAQPINTCHSRPRVVLVPTSPTPSALTSSFTGDGQQHRPWDGKYTKQFFTSNYKPYGLIEFRQWAAAIVDTNVSTSLNEYQSVSAVFGNSRSAVHEQPHTISNMRTPHFYEKIPSNLNGCEFYALLLIWPPFVTPSTATFYGLEHKLMLDVSRFMNFRMLEMYVEKQDFDQSTTHSDQLYRMLMDSGAVLAFGNVYPDIRMHRKLDHSIGYLYDLINWVVPLAENKPLWLNLLQCFR